MKLSAAIEQYNDSQLFQYLKEEIEDKENYEEIFLKCCALSYGDDYKVDCTPLQSALHHHKSKEVILKLIDIGGKELVMKEDADGYSSLHHACWVENPSLNIVTRLIEIGGKKLVMKEDSEESYTALHAACWNDNASIDVISKLIEVGGEELLRVKCYEQCTGLHCGYFCDYYRVSPQFDDSLFALLIREYITANIGGIFGIGGLFFERKLVQDKIYERWEELSPVLKSVVESLQDQQKPPILHAAILAKAPLHVIQDIIKNFQYSVLKVDSFNRNPILVAIENDLGWNEGLQQVVEATAAAQKQQKSIYTAAKYGLEWNHHMKELTEQNADILIDGCDGLTGLRLFMVAAMGAHYDLSAIYSMIRMSPEMCIPETCTLHDECKTNKRRRMIAEACTMLGECKTNKRRRLKQT